MDRRDLPALAVVQTHGGVLAMKPTRDQVLQDVMLLLNSVVQDWEFERSLDANTRLFADLAFESLDLVVLGAKVQEHFGQSLPFPQLFADIGQRDVRDLTIGEWAAFVQQHLTEPARPAPVVAQEGL
jgi:acyl carrier protein